MPAGTVVVVEVDDVVVVVLVEVVVRQLHAELHVPGFTIQEVS